MLPSISEIREWEWRRRNDVQLTLGFGVDKTPKPYYPKDLTGIVFGHAEVTGRAPDGKAKSTRWHTSCHKCGEKSIAWRSGLVTGRTVDCGGHKSEKIAEAARMKREDSGYYWYINGEKFNSAIEAAESLGVCSTTVFIWCKGGRKLKGGRLSKPKEGCYIVPKSEKSAA